MIQIHRIDFDAKARAHADGVTGWISDRIEYALVVLRFLQDGTAMDPKWHTKLPVVTAEAMGKLIPIVADGKKFEAYATPGNVLKELQDARIARKVSPQPTNLINLGRNLQAQLDHILVSPPTVLETLESTLYATFNVVEGSFAFKLVSWVFDYDWWSSERARHMTWRPCNLAELYNMRTCPYCNRNFIYSIYSDDDVFLRNFQFDHFFSQVDHPALKMSYFNLVPVCSQCNSPGYKGQNGFSVSDNLHPCMEGFGDDCVFFIRGELNGPVPLDWIENAKKLPLVLDNRLNRTDQKYQKIETSKTVFKLVSLYKGHGREVDEIVRWFRYYTKKRVSALAEEFSLLHFAEDEDFQELFGDISLDKLEMKTLSKLRRDIVNQLITQK